MNNQYTESQHKMAEESSSTPSGDNKNPGTQQLAKEKPLSKVMITTCYIVAFSLFLLLFTTFLPTISEWIGLGLKNLKLIDDEKVIDKWVVFKYTGAFFLMCYITKFIGDSFRSNEKMDVGTAVLSFPNPFYDPTFKKNASDSGRSYRALTLAYNKNLELLEESREQQNALIESIFQLEGRSRVLLRHNKNGNRIIRSLNYSYFKDNELPVEKGLKLILEECITILEKDQSDKSISLFKVDGEQLKIASSVRINFESVEKRVFMKGVGFAGKVWESNMPEIVNNITEDDPRFEDGGLPATKIGSILGYPLAIEEQVVGVLCLQSENEEGFIESDLTTVEFYARCCTLLMIHDKMKTKAAG